MRADLERAEALGYPPGMRTQLLLLPAILFTFASVQCKDETPDQPGEFGDACVLAEADAPEGCVSGLECVLGYCEETCSSNEDCQPVDGWRHECVAGGCHIYCENGACPQTLGTPMECGVNYCEAKDEDRSK